MNEMIVRTEEDLQRAVETCPDKLFLRMKWQKLSKKQFLKKN